MTKRIATAVIFLLAAAAAFAGFFRKGENAGNSNVTASSSSMTVASAPDRVTSATERAATPPELAWNTDLKASVERAKAAGKPVLIDFFATWCPPCQMMERTTFRDAGLREHLQGFELVRVDVDRAPELAREYGVQGLPTLMCVKPTGERTLAVGYQSAEDLQKLARKCMAQPAGRT